MKTSEKPKERIFAAQQISRFFKFFPEHQDIAFDSIVDLCESPDVDVRKHATMLMISISLGSRQVVPKAADILIQLYQTNQPSEVNLITQSLDTLLKLNIEEFLKSFFANFDDGSELVRERALKFLSTSIGNVGESLITREVEEQLLDYTKKAMQDVNKDEFISFMKILSKLKITKTSTGQATLVSTIKAQAELDKDFDPSDRDTLDKFLLCAKQSQPYLSIYNRASEYINYICLKVLPHLKELTNNGTDLVVLQALAEMSPHVITDDSPSLINIDECHKNVQAKLMEYLPMPDMESDTAEAEEKKPAEAAEQPAEAPKEGEASAPTDSSDATKANNGTKQQEADFQFTHIEYLMYTLMQLSRLKPELYSETMQMESRKQLQHLSNGCKKYTDALERVGGKSQDLRSVALRTTKNISAMIIGLFRRPSDFKVVTAINLSCKPVPAAAPIASQPAGAPTQAATKKPQQSGQNYRQHNKRSNYDHGYNNKKRFKIYNNNSV